VAAGNHDGGFELVGPLVGEDGAVAAVEEGVEFQKGDGVDGCVEGASGTSGYLVC